MQGLLRCNINAGVHAREQSGRVTQRCHNSPDGKRGYTVRMTSRTGSARRILGFWKSQFVELRPASGEDRWLSLARRSKASGLCGGYRTRWVADEKARIEKMFLSPYIEEPLNSTLIKSFVPEQRVRKCFSCFEIHTFYVIYKWTLYVHFAYPYRAMVHKASPVLWPLCHWDSFVCVCECLIVN